MTINKRTALSSAALFAILLAPLVHATPIELVENGEFEAPDINGLGFGVVVPGWSCSAACEIFDQGFAGSPTIGSDGLGTGQHHEITLNSALEYTTQAVGGLPGNGFVDLSFDAWRRLASGIDYSLTGSLSGVLASGSHSFATSGWEALGATGLAVQGGETLTLSFQSVGGGSAGAHIDQVSLMYTQVPEPGTLALLGLGLAGLGMTRRRRLSA